MIPKQVKSLPSPEWKKSLKFAPTFTEKKEPKPISPIGKRKKERIAKEGTENDVFLKIWEERPRICSICKSQVIDAFIDGKLIKPQCFAHILSKGMYPKHRTNPVNIALVCSIDCHHKLDEKFLSLEKRRKFEASLIS